MMKRSSHGVKPSVGKKYFGLGRSEAIAMRQAQWPTNANILPGRRGSSC